MFKYFAIITLLFSLTARAQIHIDGSSVDTTTSFDRYVDYSDQLLVRIMSVAKSNDLEIVNNNNQSLILLKPYGITSLGFGFNHKWLGLGVAFGLPATAEEEQKFGKTKRFDFQVHVYSKKVVIDAFSQHYRGYYFENAAQLANWNSPNYPQLKDMNSFALGVGGFYVFNYKKFSYKAAYVRNAVQKKSAGSFLLGGFYNSDHANAGGSNSSFVPDFFSTEVRDSLPIKAYTARTGGISFGYTYTVVFFKRFFLNLSLIPGVGVKDLSVTKVAGEYNGVSGVGRFSARFALGYENKYFLLGLTSTSTTGDFKFEDYSIKPTSSLAKFFIAKRFNVKKRN